MDVSWIQDRWPQLAFNRLNFERDFVVDQVLSQKPRSCVLLARRRGGSRQTIMKLIEPAAANPQEARCLRSLRHPNIAGFLGHGVTRDHRLWIETEYIDGVPLSAWLDLRDRAKRVSIQKPPTESRDIFLQLISVVQYLHCCGWLHGDLAPQNILILPKLRRAVLVDFEHVAATNRIDATCLPRKHSLAFASPQELDGGATTEACEQFALGKLGLMLLGPAEHFAKSQLEAVLQRATASHPYQRYQDLAALVHDFEAALECKRSTHAASAPDNQARHSC